MARKCPPGVICIENITIIFLIFILCLAAFIWYKFGNTNTNTDEKQNHHYISIANPTLPKFNSIFSTSASNILMNPFAAPLKNGNYFPRDGGDP